MNSSRQTNERSHGPHEAAAVSVSGGAAPYSYNWTNAARPHRPSRRVRPGKYRVSVTDADRCVPVCVSLTW